MTDAHALTIDVSQVQVANLMGGVNVFFARMSPDASPGRNELTISGLPAGTRGVTAWVTEWIPPDNPHAGSAILHTQSVQLFDNGTKCRVIFNLDWGSGLPAAAQVMYS